MRTDRATHLTNKITSLPNMKIITVTSKGKSYKFDVHPDGFVDPRNKLYRTIKNAMSGYGSIIVRQFTDMIYKKVKDGPDIKYKYIYGIILKRGNFKYLTVEEFLELYEYKEKDVVLKSFKNAKK